jgi:putative NADPH-quinone reductase
MGLSIARLRRPGKPALMWRNVCRVRTAYRGAMSRIVVIEGHPDPSPERLNHALAEAYAQGARLGGHVVHRLHAGNMDVPPLRSSAEFESGQLAPGIADAQRCLRDAHHWMLIYPLWLGTMPAHLKSFLEHTLRPGFAFRAETGLDAGLMGGRSARVVVTMGMPGLFYRVWFGAPGLRAVRRNILGFVGVAPVRTTVIGSAGNLDPHRALFWLRRMSELGRRAM